MKRVPAKKVRYAELLPDEFEARSRVTLSSP